ncbi:hypothetical protein PAXRUDRAFT_9790 [Paxillus rubicundulus Ve08.2h10]|uniref:C2H2-type domain-containing protein n=1 Tax=Paxillus rubicundulus Ve08.2h10 TaxID=930991 RepID=A0A0D0DUM5_9AGAM|nr:hypothetical protein PAXRUDRAFT_9790 [Paxillus rubicundulus Ve08.2h10]
MTPDFSENMHPPKDWKPPARPNASFKACASRALPQDWPARFKYPPLPFDHPLAASICNPPVIAPTAIDDVVARPAIPPRHPDPSPSVPSTNKSPFGSPASLAPVSSFTPQSSHVGVDRSPYWTQFHPNGSMTPVYHQDVSGLTPGPYSQPQGNRDQDLPSTLSNTSVDHPLSLDTINIPTAVHHNVHAPDLFAFEQVDHFPNPAPPTGLPSSHEFTFACDPQVQSTGAYYMGNWQSNLAQYHFQYQNNNSQYSLSTPLVNHRQSLDTLNLPSVVHHGISAPSSIIPTPYLVPLEDAARLSGPSPLTALPNSYEFSLTCDTQSERHLETTLFLQEQGARFQFDQQNLTVNYAPSEVTLPLTPEQTTELRPEDFDTEEDYWAALFAPEVLHARPRDINQFTAEASLFQPDATSCYQYQDYADTQSQLTHENNPFPVHEAPESYAPDPDEAAAALVLSVIAPPRPAKKMNKTRKSKACHSTDASTTPSVAQSTHDYCGSQASSSTHSVYPPGYQLAQSMPIAGPSSGQVSSSTSHRGQKRSSSSSGPESDNEGDSKRPRLLETRDGANRYFCHTCQEWVAKNRKRIHERSRRHSGETRFFCRICMKLNKTCRGHSRKDSLKRHIKQQHSDISPLICETFPSILDSYDPNEGRQDWEDMLIPPQQ